MKFDEHMRHCLIHRRSIAIATGMAIIIASTRTRRGWSGSVTGEMVCANDMMDSQASSHFRLETMRTRVTTSTSAGSPVAADGLPTPHASDSSARMATTSARRFDTAKENEYCKHSVHPGSTDMSDVIRTVDSFLDELTIEINRMAYDEYEQEDEVDLWLTMFLDELRKAEVDMCKKFAMVMMMNKVGLKPCSKKKNHSEAHEAARSGRSVTFAA